MIADNREGYMLRKGRAPAREMGTGLGSGSGSGRSDKPAEYPRRGGQRKVRECGRNGGNTYKPVLGKRIKDKRMA